MRVLLDTTYSRLAPYSGTAVYIRMLLGELARLDEVEAIPACNPRRRSPAGGGLGSVRNLLRDRWWTARELPRLARELGADLIHHPLPAYAHRSDVPQVATVMDLAFERLPRCFDRRFRLYARSAHRKAARAADAVVCISETTAADARELWGLDPERTVVAQLGPGQALAPGRNPRPTGRTTFLYVGDNEPRKNVGTLIEAYAAYRRATESPAPLVLAGSASAWGPGIEVQERPSRDRLAELYADALALVHPSLYEGFGLTPLEAMAAGIPVIAARSPGVTEICADAALYADPHSPSSFAHAMTRLGGDPALRRELAERGRRRAGEFSWSSCARRHVAAYSLALESANEDRHSRHARHPGLL